MALLDWQHEFLSSVPDLTGLSHEDSQSVLRVVLFKDGDALLTPDETIDLLVGDSGRLAYMRFLAVGRAQADAAHAGVVAAASEEGRGDDASDRVDHVEAFEPHPDLQGLLGQPLDDLLRLPDIRRLHAYAQSTLLRSIQRLEEVSTPAELAALADAYLTLPPPDEDTVGGA